jgi:hypothetical protein
MKIVPFALIASLLSISCDSTTREKGESAISGKYRHETSSESETTEFWKDSVSNTILFLPESCVILHSKRTFLLTSDSLCFSQGTALTRSNCAEELKIQSFEKLCRKIRNIDESGYELYRPSTGSSDTGNWYLYEKVE